MWFCCDLVFCQLMRNFEEPLMVKYRKLRRQKACPIPHPHFAHNATIRAHMYLPKRGWLERLFSQVAIVENSQVAEGSLVGI